MPETPQATPDEAAPRRRPARWWYAVAAALMLVSAGVFAAVLLSEASRIRGQIEPMPRFVAPTGDSGVTIHLDHAGKYTLFHENRGTLDGRSFDTPRRQVWTTFDAPSMTCSVFDVHRGEPLAVRLPGVGEKIDKREVTRDLIYTYDLPDRQGHGAWVFEIDRPGDYRIELAYVEEVYLQPDDIDVPAELTAAMQQGMTSDEGKAYEQARRDALERLELSRLEPVEVLFAVGPDPTRGGYFELLGLKGAATVFAFGFTFSLLIAGVTFMLRHGHVTPRGELADVRRLGFSEHEA